MAVYWICVTKAKIAKYYLLHQVKQQEIKINLIQK